MSPRRRWARRALLAVGVATAALAAYVTLVEPGRLTVEQTEISVPGLQRDLRVVVLADLHVGAPHVGVDKLREIVALANAQEPDLVFLLGDYVIDDVVGGTPIPIEPIAAQLGELHATHGVIAVLGNHDWWNDGEAISAALTRAGIVVLEDAAKVIDLGGQPLVVVGIGDLMTRPADVEGALAGVAPNVLSVVLSHNPDVFVRVPKHVELTLAGHTHGGQVNLPLLGRLVVPSAYGERFAAGLIEEDGRRMFVSTGVGTSILPVRFRVVPVVDVVELSARD